MSRLDLALVPFLGFPLIFFGGAPSEPVDPARIAQAQAHYAQVEEELASADVHGLAPGQIEARAELLAALREYRIRGDFGRAFEFPDARVPHFVDSEGRRCAVAELLHSTGEDGLVEAVRAADNHAWVVDLSKDARFQRWLERNGLTLWEAARIQIPVTGGGRGGPPDGGGRSASPDRVAPSAPSSPGPSTAAPSRAAPAPTRTGTTAPPATAGTPSPSSTPGLPTALNLTTQSDDGWWLWWEYNKLEFLRPNRLDDWAFPATGDGSGIDRTAAVRRELFPTLESALGNADAGIRGAAALALGRIGRSAAVEPLLRALSDRSLQVRHRAILALGSSGAPEAVEPLLALARDGRPRPESKERVSPFASPLAVVALALGRRIGFEPAVDAEVARIASSARGSDRDAVRNAAFVYHKISPCAELEKLALETSLDSTQAPSARCRAAESLSSSREDRTLSRIQSMLTGPRLDLRRSAALALGDSLHPLALPPLMSAFETESEPLTKGFILISIGRLGGEKARDHLLRVLQNGETGMRKWAALGLGLAARRDGDAGTTRKAIRSGLEREKNRDAVAAYWIASGLARDEGARARVQEGLWRAADPRARMYAATALAMIGGEPSARALRERLPQETSSIARVAIAQALGYLGLEEDSTLLAGVLETLRDPSLQGLTATAIGFHGAIEDFRALSTIAKLEGGSPVRRASAIEGLGMLLGGSPPLVLGEASRQSNYTMFTDWVEEMLQTTL